MRGTCSCWQPGYFLPSTLYHACVASIPGRIPPSLGNCCDSASRKKQTPQSVRVCVCVSEGESEHGGHSGRRSQLLSHSFFPPALCGARGSAGRRVLCSPVPEESSQAEWQRAQPAMELQMDRLSETHRTRVTVATARRGTRTPVVSVK